MTFRQICPSYKVSVLQKNTCISGDAGSNESKVDGPACVLGVVEHHELIVVGVPVELSHHRSLKSKYGCQH